MSVPGVNSLLTQFVLRPLAATVLPPKLKAASPAEREEAEANGKYTQADAAEDLTYIFGVITKSVWVFLQPFFYGIRPLLIKPKPLIPAEILNWAVVIAFDMWIAQNCGKRALCYLVLGSWLGLGFHPMAGHFIAEHFEFVEGQETYSYYGFWGNFFGYNVGYHNEHHDFPRVPGRLLPKVRDMCRGRGFDCGGKGPGPATAFFGGPPGVAQEEELAMDANRKRLDSSASDDASSDSGSSVSSDGGDAAGSGSGGLDAIVPPAVPPKKEGSGEWGSEDADFYERLPHYRSWPLVTAGFIFRRNMNCYCRVKRVP